MSWLPPVFRRGYLTPEESPFWVFFSCVGVVCCAINIPAPARLTYRGAETQGWIVEKQPDNHRDLRYSYRVNNQTYDMVGRGGCGNPQFEDLQVGDRVLVIYDPQEPQFSMLGNVSCNLKAGISDFLFALITAPIMFRLLFRFSRALRELRTPARPAPEDKDR